MTEAYLAENFLAVNSFGVLAVVDAEGKPHASMMHFAMGEDALFDVYMATSSKSRKVEALVNGTTDASFVVGSGDVWKTLQMDGVLRKITDEKEKEVARLALYAKYPQDKYHEIEDAVFMHFKASWYRYADFGTEPALVLPWGEQTGVRQLSNPE